MTNSWRISNLAELRRKPEILGLTGVEDRLARWADADARANHWRIRVERSAFADMAPSELRAYFLRLGLEATKAWKRKQSAFGRLRNLIEAPKPGYAKISGNVLFQAMDAVGMTTSNEIKPGSELYMRADIALDLSELIALESKDK